MRLKTCLTWLLLLLLAGPSAHANPTGGTVAGGRATITPGANGTVIRQWTDNAIINWKTFNISPGEVVQFIQGGPNAVALNRVLGGVPSVILGTLTANGKIFLINPDGVIFGQGAVVDVGSLMATTLDIANTDFLNGKYQFNATTGAPAYVINLGQIKTAFGGYVTLLAPLVNNSGAILAQSGTVTLAGTRASTVNFDGTGMVSYVTPTNLPPGTVVLPASFVTNVVSNAVASQSADAGGIVVNPNGTVSLTGAAGLSAHSGSVIANGGQVYVLGDKVVLNGSASIDVSSPFVPGTAIVGGSPSNSAIPQSQSTYVGRGVTIDANATNYGNGGHIVVDSAGSTEMDGTLTATGGALHGNGGLIETSGHTLAIAGTPPDASAPNGQPGKWLLDPANVCINASGCTLPPCGKLTPSANSTVSASSISSALSSGTSVTICTVNSSGCSAGDINVNHNICSTAASTPLLTLNAANNVNINAQIFGSMAFTASGKTGVKVGTCSGVTVKGNITLTGGSVSLQPFACVNSACGNASITGSSLSMRGAVLSGKNVTANVTGPITINAGSCAPFGIKTHCATGLVTLNGSCVSGSAGGVDVAGGALSATATSGAVNLTTNVRSLNASATGNVTITNAGAPVVGQPFTNCGCLSIGTVTSGGNVSISTVGNSIGQGVVPASSARHQIQPNVCATPANITLGSITAAGGITLSADGNILNDNSCSSQRQVKAGSSSNFNLTAGSCSSLSAGGFIGTSSNPLLVNIKGALSVKAGGENTDGVSVDMAGEVKPSNALTVANPSPPGKVIFTDLTPPNTPTATPTTTPTSTPTTTPTTTTTSTPTPTTTPTTEPTVAPTTTTSTGGTTVTVTEETVTQSVGEGEAQVNNVASSSGVTNGIVSMNAGSEVASTTTHVPTVGPAISPIGYTANINNYEPPQNGNPDRFVLSELLEASLSDPSIPVAGLDDSELNAPLSRAEYVAFIVNAVGHTEDARKLKGTAAFEDTATHWASGFIAEAKALALLNAGDKRFEPDRKIDFAEALAILLRALGFPPTTGTYPGNVMARAAELDIVPADLAAAATSTPPRSRIYQMLDRAFYNVKLASGKTFYQTRFVKRPPVVTLNSYPTLSQATSITLSGAVSADTTRLLVGYSEKDVVQIQPDGTFTAIVPLTPGVNSITIQAHDPLGNITSETIQIMCTAGI